MPWKTEKNKGIFKIEQTFMEINNNQFHALIQKLTNTSVIEEVSEKVDGASFRVKSNEYFVTISEENIDVDAEIEKLESELKRAKGFLSGIQKKLSNL